MTCVLPKRRGAPETNRRRGAPETNRRRGAPRGNRNALKSGYYTAEAKAERRRRRLLLKLLRTGLAYARSVIRARTADKIFKNRKTIPAGTGAGTGLPLPFAPNPTILCPGRGWAGECLANPARAERQQPYRVSSGSFSLFHFFIISSPEACWTNAFPFALMHKRSSEGEISL